MRTGRSGKGSNHSPPCRARIELRLREDGDPRVQEAVDRFAEALAPQIEAAEVIAQEEEPVPTPAAHYRGPEAATSLVRRARLAPAPAERVAPAPTAAAPQAEDDAEDLPPLVAEDEDSDSDMNIMGSMMPEDDDSDDDQDEFLQYLTKTMPRKVRRDFGNLYEMFLVSGVSRSDALAKVSELFSPPRLTKELRTLPKLHLKGGTTFDLEEDALGVKSDFTCESDRRRCRERILAEKPFFVIGSPPCTMFSSLMIFNRTRMDPQKYQQKLSEARVLLGFVAEIYQLQVDGGRHVLHEHPQGASSWKETAIQKILQIPAV